MRRRPSPTRSPRAASSATPGVTRRAGAWPEERPPVSHAVGARPARGDPVDELLVLLDKSRVAIRTAAGRIEGHELGRRRMRHPLIGHLRCGDWLLFVGMHDLMHLEQLHGLAAVSLDDG